MQRRRRRSDTLSPKSRIILAAERLFAVHGLEGVSLRRIAAEAGTANTSAVHYHFGTKDGLIDAILAFRLPLLNQRRELLYEFSAGDDARSVLEAHVLPLFEQAQVEGSHYLTFVERLASHEVDANPLVSLAPAYRIWHEHFRARMQEHLGHLPEEVLLVRVQYAMRMALHVSAARERALRAGLPVADLRIEVAQILDALAGLLGAPAAEATRAAVAGAPGPGRE